MRSGSYCQKPKIAKNKKVKTTDGTQAASYICFNKACRGIFFQIPPCLGSHSTSVAWRQKSSPEFPADFLHLPPFARPNLPLFPPHLSSNDAKPCAKRTDNGKKCVNKKCIRDGKNASTRAHSGHCYCMCPVATYTTALTSDPAHFKGTNICFLDRSTSHHNI